MKAIPPSMHHDGTRCAGSRPHRMAPGKARHPESPGFRRGLLVPNPNSPGWKPGDTGNENHPAVHATRRHTLRRFTPAPHGTREGQPPGVPRLPPGAFRPRRPRRRRCREARIVRRGNTRRFTRKRSAFPRLTPRASRNGTAQPAPPARSGRRPRRGHDTRTASASCVALLSPPPPALESPPSRRAASRRFARSGRRPRCGPHPHAARIDAASSRRVPQPRCGHGRLEGRPPGRPAMPCARTASASCLALLSRPPPALEGPPSRRAASRRFARSGRRPRCGPHPHAARIDAASSRRVPQPRCGHGRLEGRPPGRPANPWRSPRRPKPAGARDGPAGANHGWPDSREVSSR